MNQEAFDSVGSEQPELLHWRKKYPYEANCLKSSYGSRLPRKEALEQSIPILMYKKEKQ